MRVSSSGKRNFIIETEGFYLRERQSGLQGGEIVDIRTGFVMGRCQSQERAIDIFREMMFRYTDRYSNYVMPQE